jgi:hypothetical protein
MSGEITEHVFTSHLDAATGGANNATLQYLFSTFDSDKLITTGTMCCCSSIRTVHARRKNLSSPSSPLPVFVHAESNYSFAVTPALLKFSLNVSSWRWNSTYAAALMH